MSTQKQCEKKLREIYVLKQKKQHTKEETEKINREQYYKAQIKDVHVKYLDTLPDDIQFHILGFLDANTRLKYLRSKYTDKFIHNKLSLLPNNKATIKKLFSCIKYVTPIFLNYLHLCTFKTPILEDKKNMQKCKINSRNFTYDGLTFSSSF